MARDRPRTVVPALVGGFFIGALSALPIINLANLCCCLWVVCGGIVAAHFARQDRRGTLTMADGALVGLLAGIFGAIFWALLMIPIHALTMPLQTRWFERLVENARDMPPELRDWMREVGAGGASMISLMVGFLFTLAAGVVFSTIGGLLGSLFFGSGSRSTSSGVDLLPPEGS